MNDSPSHNRMQLLVSVRNAQEAETAISAGADWIDMKDPSRGALGAVDPQSARDIAGLVASRLPLSAALGELRDWSASDCSQLLAIPRLKFVKLGLSGMSKQKNWQQRWRDADQQAAEAGKRLVAVAYADWQSVAAPSPVEVIELAADSAARCLLIDTFRKDAPGTLGLWDPEALASTLRSATTRGLRVVLAGKIRRMDLSQVPGELIDLIAVRGAVCRSGRESNIDGSKVAEFISSLIKLSQDHTQRKQRFAPAEQCGKT